MSVTVGVTLNGKYWNDWKQIFEIIFNDNERYFIHLSIINHYTGDTHRSIILERMGSSSSDREWQLFYGYSGLVLISFDDNGDISFYRNNELVLRYDKDTLAIPASLDDSGYQDNDDEYVTIKDYNTTISNAFLNGNCNIVSSNEFIDLDKLHVFNYAINDDETILNKIISECAE